MYPRTITIENKKLAELITKKGELVTKGREVTDQIEKLEIEMEVINQELIAEEKKVDIQDLLDKEKVITAKVDEAIKEMHAVNKEIKDRMLSQVPPELHTQYDELLKVKEEKEGERNKIALKAQKYNDKIIPMARLMIKPFLQDQYEDYDSLQLEDGEVVATIFSHLNDFKTNFKRRQ